MSEVEILKRVKNIENEIKKILLAVNDIHSEVSSLEKKHDYKIREVIDKLSEIQSSIYNLE